MIDTKSNLNQAPGLLVNRRTSLSSAIIALVFLPAMGLSFIGCNRAAVANKSDPPPSWNVKITSDAEPGEPLIVSGTVYSPDGTKPLEGI
ncbi:MAG: hypothetical protein ACXW3C_19200, partial [Pyrinomonadaceae bacterium]